MSASSTALPRMRAATAIEMEEDGASPVLSSINTRINATMMQRDEKVDRRREDVEEFFF